MQLLSWSWPKIGRLRRACYQQELPATQIQIGNVRGMSAHQGSAIESGGRGHVRTVVGEHHTGIVVGVGGGFPFGKGGCFLLWRLLLVPGQLSPHGEDVTC